MNSFDMEINSFQEVLTAIPGDSVQLLSFLTYGNLDITLRDSSGSTLFSDRYFGSAAVTDIESTGDDLYLLGHYNGQLIIPGVASLDRTALLDQRASFLMRMDRSGAVQWVMDIGQLGLGEHAYTLDLGPNGDLFLGIGSDSNFNGASHVTSPRSERAVGR